MNKTKEMLSSLDCFEKIAVAQGLSNMLKETLEALFDGYSKSCAVLSMEAIIFNELKHLANEYQKIVFDKIKAFPSKDMADLICKSIDKRREKA